MDFHRRFEDEQVTGANGLSIDWQHSGEVDGNSVPLSWVPSELDESSISYFQDLFNRAVGDDTRKTYESTLQGNGSSSGQPKGNTYFGSKRGKRKGKRGQTLEEPNGDNARVGKKKKVYYKQKSFVYNGTRCRFPISHSDDLLLDPVIWYRACADFQRAGVVTDMKLQKLRKDSKFSPSDKLFPLSFEKKVDVINLYRRFSSALPLKGVIKLCIFRYIVDLLLALYSDTKNKALNALSDADLAAIDRQAQDLMIFLFRDNDDYADNSTLPSSFEKFVDRRRQFVSSQTSEDIVRTRLRLSEYGKSSLKIESTTFQPTLHKDLIPYFKNSVKMLELLPLFSSTPKFILAEPVAKGKDFYVYGNSYEATSLSCGTLSLAHWHIESSNEHLNALRKKVCSHLCGNISACAVFAIKQQWGDKYFQVKVMEIEQFLSLKKLELSKM